MLKYLVVFLGAGVGGVLRYVLGSAVRAWWGEGFPMGTLVVNVSGCLAIGFLATWLMGTGAREEWRLALVVGVLGGYTTFSSFGYETLTLAQQGAWGRAAVYVVVSNVVGLAAVWLGSVMGTRVVGG